MPPRVQTSRRQACLVAAGLHAVTGKGCCWDGGATKSSGARSPPVGGQGVGGQQEPVSEGLWVGVLTILGPLSPSGAQNRRRGRVEGRSHLHKSPGAVLASEITHAAWSPCGVQANRAFVLSCLPENPTSACMTAVSWQWGTWNFMAGSLCLVSPSGP